MSGLINTGSIPRALAEGLTEVWDAAGKNWDPIYTKIYSMSNSKKAYEVSLQMENFGLPSLTGEGDDITFDSIRQSFAPKFVHAKFTKGFAVSREAMDDNLYGLFKDGASALRRCFNVNKEIRAHVLLNTAFSSSSAMTGGDGLSMCNTAHINGPSGGTFSNRMTIDADFSEAALEDVLKLVLRAKDDRNLAIRLKAKQVIGHTDNQWNFERVMNSDLRSDTVNNDINAVKSTNSVGGGYMVTPYLDANPRSWFVQTDAEQGLTGYQRTALEFGQDMSFTNGNIRFKGYERFVFGFKNPRAIYGSNGS